VSGELMFHNRRMSDPRSLLVPPAAPSQRRRVWAWLGLIASAIYLLNLDMGVFELIPDFVPVVGNLDEAGATLLFLKCLSTLRTASPASPDAPK